jgi:hypothetical protein
VIVTRATYPQFCRSQKQKTMTRKSLSHIGLSLVAAILLCLPAIGKEVKPVSSQPARAVLYWNEIAYEAFGGVKYQHSLMASRINAMVQLAIHDAVNAIEPRYARYAFKGFDHKADPTAAVAAAAYEVLVNEIPEKKSFLDSALAQAMKSVFDDNAKKRGLSLGKDAAKSVLAKRYNDGAKGDPIGKLGASNVAGIYEPVPPFNFVFAPNWENVTLFSLKSKDQFRVRPFPSMNSPEYTKAFNEVKDYGRQVSSVRTADQTAFAKYWYEFSEAGWNRVARTVITDKNMNMLEAARLLALVDMAIADAYTAGWDSKFHYNFWRPYTAIRKADIDNNSNTTADTSWMPCEVTPPVHDYPSTHSALGNAAATVLAKILGDNTPFSMPSPTAMPAGSTRSFNSFTQAANENAESRVMAGIHFRFSCEAGQDLGNKIGEWTVQNHLKPLEEKKK